MFAHPAAAIRGQRTFRAGSYTDQNSNTATIYQHQHRHPQPTTLNAVSTVYIQQPATLVIDPNSAYAQAAQQQCIGRNIINTTTKKNNLIDDDDVGGFGEYSNHTSVPAYTTNTVTLRQQQQQQQQQVAYNVEHRVLCEQPPVAKKLKLVAPNGSTYITYASAVAEPDYAAIIPFAPAVGVARSSNTISNSISGTFAASRDRMANLVDSGVIVQPALQRAQTSHSRVAFSSVASRLAGSISKDNVWFCDFGCNSKFCCFEEAEHHEAICSMNPCNKKKAAISSSSSSSSPKRSSSTTKGDEKKAAADKAMLGIPDDKHWLSDLLCLVRKNIEVFSATSEDVASRSHRGGLKTPIKVGRVGLRCVHCKRKPPVSRAKGSVSYPCSTRIIHQAVRNMQRYHFDHCEDMPDDVREKYNTLKSVRSHSGNASMPYWIDSAKSLGLVDTPSGMFFHKDAYGAVIRKPLTLLDDTKNSVDESLVDMGDGGNLVFEQDRGSIPDFLYLLWKQQQKCRYKDVDRLGKRKFRDNGFPGVECRHCARNAGAGRYFPLTLTALANNNNPFNCTHSHMMKCASCPKEVKDELNKAQATFAAQSASLRKGWRKKFYEALWDRLYVGR